MNSNRSIIAIILAIFISQLIIYTTISFAEDQVSMVRISGYVKADIDCNNQQFLEGFTVEIAKTGIVAHTDKSGYYEIFELPENPEGYILKISKSNFITREIKFNPKRDMILGSLSKPILMWSGDMNINGKCDNVINMADVMRVAVSFGSTQNDENYDSECDLDKNNVINMADIIIMVRHFGCSSTDYPEIEATFVPDGFIDVEATNNESFAIKSDGSLWQCGIESKNIFTKVEGIENVRSVATFGNATLVLKHDGTVWAWGYNGNGQLGDGTKIDCSVPKKVEGLENIKDIKRGFYSSFALKDDGTIWVWGDNGSGQLGDGTTQNKYSPVQLNGISDVVQVSAGTFMHTLALKKDGTVWAWGLGSSGQLGNGDFKNSSLPIQVKNLPPIKYVCAANEYSIAVDLDGNVWVWGYIVHSKEPKKMEIQNVKHIWAKYSNIIAMMNDGSVYGFGDNSSGQLGPSYRNTGEFYPLTEFHDLLKVSGGVDFSLALMKNGTILGFGTNNYGELGNGIRNNYNFPKKVEKLGNGVIKAVAGANHKVALLKNGTVWAWGKNNFGQLGIDAYNNKYLPEQNQLIKDVKDIAAGQDTTYALKEDGTVWGWGYEIDVIPVLIKGLYNIKSITASSSDKRLIALKDDGTVWTWVAGKNSIPQKITDLENVSTLAIGNLSIYAIKIDGTTWEKSLIREEKSKQIQGLNNIRFVSSGSEHCLALKDDGTVWAWGKNNSGQLGNGTKDNKTEPFIIENLSRVKAVSAAGETSMAVLDDGTVWAWGANMSGVYGNGTYVDSLTPVKALGGGYQGISVGGIGYSSISIAIKENGELYELNPEVIPPVKVLDYSSTEINCIVINNEPIEGFIKDKTEYIVDISDEIIETPYVEVRKIDGIDNVEITQAESSTGTAKIHITARDGVNKNTYTIKFR